MARTKKTARAIQRSFMPSIEEKRTNVQRVFKISNELSIGYSYESLYLLSNKSFKKLKLIRDNEKDYQRLITDVKVYSKGIVAINFRDKNIELYKIVENDLVLMRELSEKIGRAHV